MQGKKLAPIMLLAPIALLYFVFIGGGLFETIKESLGYIPNLNMNDISFKSFGSLFGQANFIRNTLYSIYLVFVSTLLSTFFWDYHCLYFCVIKSSFYKSDGAKDLTGRSYYSIYLCCIPVNYILRTNGFCFKAFI